MTPIKPNWKAHPLKSALVARRPKSNTSQNTTSQFDATK